jgi:hypothetical protein
LDGFERKWPFNNQNIAHVIFKISKFNLFGMII